MTIDGGCGYLSFIPAYASRYDDVDPFPASLSGWAAIPEADFQALWTTLLTHVGLLSRLTFTAGPVEPVIPDGWRWNTSVSRHLLIERASVSFFSSGWQEE